MERQVGDQMRSKASRSDGVEMDDDDDEMEMIISLC
jgi:hypothetical protein